MCDVGKVDAKFPDFFSEEADYFGGSFFQRFWDWASSGEDEEAEDGWYTVGWRSDFCDDKKFCEGVEASEEFVNEWLTREPELMRWRQWMKVFMVTMAKKKGTKKGDEEVETETEMILVRRMRGKNGRFSSIWVAVDDDRKYHMCNVGDKKKYRPRRSGSGTLKKCRKLSAQEMAKVEAGAAKLAERHEGMLRRSSSSGRSATSGKQQKPQSSSTSSTNQTKDSSLGPQWTMINMGVSSGTLLWALKTGALAPTLAFLAWKTITFLQVPEGVMMAVESGTEMVEWAEEQRDSMKDFFARLKTLPWDWMVPILVLVVILILQILQSRKQADQVVFEDDGYSSDGSDSAGTESDMEDDDDKKSTHKMMAEMKADFTRQMEAMRRSNEERAAKARADAEARKVQEERNRDKIQIRDLVSRLQVQQEIVRRDADAERRANEAPMCSNRGRRRGDQSPQSDDVEVYIQELKGTTADGKDYAVAQLEKFSPDINYKLPLNMKERVNMMLTAKVLKRGGTYVKFFTQWLTDRGLMQSSIAGEILLLARAMDADLQDEDQAATQKESFEIKARRLYGYLQAFAEVRCENDWRKPTGNAARTWKTKVNWAKLDAFDIPALERDRLSVENVDAETQNALGARRRTEAYLTELGNAPLEPGVTPHVLVVDDSATQG